MESRVTSSPTFHDRCSAFNSNATVDRAAISVGLGGTLANKCGKLRALRGELGNLMFDCFDALRRGGTNGGTEIGRPFGASQ
jgi:hypothetical protein